MCRSTVRVLTESAVAIAWLLPPPASSARISTSRAVSPSGRGGSVAAAAADRTGQRAFAQADRVVELERPARLERGLVGRFAEPRAERGQRPPVGRELRQFRHQVVAGSSPPPAPRTAAPPVRARRPRSPPSPPAPATRPAPSRRGSSPAGRARRSCSATASSRRSCSIAISARLLRFVASTHGSSRARLSASDRSSERGPRRDRLCRARPRPVGSPRTRTNRQLARRSKIALARPKSSPASS